ncbi:MAG: hypothetical protein CMO55_08520 [Verrucomicrobiales bacterium]|nr:hypothetical protein [Verrucomicrobiales bacterium]
MEGKSSFPITDTHAHLASERFQDELDDIVARAVENNVSRIVTIACDVEDSVRNLELAQTYSPVLPTVGIHPLYVHETEADWENRLQELAKTPGVAAIGEIGLDYYHPPADGSTEKEWRALQSSVFERLLQLAVELKLPVVIHQRNSADDVTAILRQFPDVTAVLHCFSGSTKEAETALEMGHFLSFTGILTFPKAEEVREVAAMVPLDRIMIETDCPYLAPVPYRGKRCEPYMVASTLEKLAQIRGLSVTEAAQLTTGNAGRFFNAFPEVADS